MSSLSEPDQPRGNASQAEIARKLALLDAPHVAPLSAFVRRLRDSRGGDRSIPWFDPTEAGTQARIVMLFEAPGRRATQGQGSGFISADNNDGSAANMWELLREAGIDRKREIVAWNVVPWYLGTDNRIRAATAEDLGEAHAALEEFLSLLEEPRVVILFGKLAAEAWEQIGAEIPTIRAPHPSPRNLNGRPDYRPRILNALRQARREAGLAELPPIGTAITDPPPSRLPETITSRSKSTPKPQQSTPRTSTEEDRDGSPETIRALLVDGWSTERIAARYDRRRGPWLAAIEEEAKAPRRVQHVLAYIRERGRIERRTPASLGTDRGSSGRRSARDVARPRLV